MRKSGVISLMLSSKHPNHMSMHHLAAAVRAKKECVKETEGAGRVCSMLRIEAKPHVCRAESRQDTN